MTSQNFDSEVRQYQQQFADVKAEIANHGGSYRYRRGSGFVL